MRAWFLRVFKKVGELLLVLVALVLILAVSFWVGSGLDWLSETISGQHAGWLNNTLRIFLGILALCTWMALRIMVAGGFNGPWVVRRRKRMAENFYLPAIVPLFGRGKTIQFRPRHVLFTAQPRAALGIDRNLARLRLMSLDGRGDVAFDLPLVQRAVYLPGRNRWFSWLLRTHSPALRLYLHARDYSQPVFYTLVVAQGDKVALRRFHALLQAALHGAPPPAIPSSQEWAAVLPRYSGAAAIESGGYWPPRPRYQATAQSA